MSVASVCLCLWSLMLGGVQSNEAAAGYNDWQHRGAPNVSSGRHTTTPRPTHSVQVQQRRSYSQFVQRSSTQARHNI